MRLRKRWLIVALAVFLVVTPIIAAQTRKISPEYPYAVCENCHASEGYLPLEMVASVPPEVEKGQVFNVSLFVVNPWEHDIENIDAAVNLSLAEENVEFVGGGSNDTRSYAGTVEGEQRRTRTMAVGPGLTSYEVRLHNASPGLGNMNRWAVRLFDPNDQIIETCTAGPGTAQQANTSCGFSLDEQDANDTVKGDWTLEVALTDTQNLTGVHHWELDVAARYTVDLENHKSKQNTPSIQDLGPFGQQKITWQLQSTAKGDYTLIFKTTARLWFDHETHSTNSDTVTDQVEIGATVGDQFIEPESEVGGVQVKKDTTAFMRSWGKVTGFASLLMILPSFLFVGVFSKHNKYAMNRFFGNARNRVVWHAAVSWIIIMLAVVHTLLFLMEPRFEEFDFIDFKYVTGWAALGFMTALGVTGLWQIPLTKKIGYKWWRNLHMYMGFAAFGLSIVHTLYDGEDFAWLVPIQRTRTVESIVVSGLGSWLESSLSALAQLVSVLGLL